MHALWIEPRLVLALGFHPRRQPANGAEAGLRELVPKHALAVARLLAAAVVAMASLDAVRLAAEVLEKGVVGHQAAVRVGVHRHERRWVADARAAGHRLVGLCARDRARLGSAARAGVSCDSRLALAAGPLAVCAARAARQGDRAGHGCRSEGLAAGDSRSNSRWRELFDRTSGFASTRPLLLLACRRRRPSSPPSEPCRRAHSASSRSRAMP